MKLIKHESKNGGVIIMLLLIALLALGVVGCTQHKGFEVIPASSRNVLALSADDIVQVMRRAGFSDNQILEIGTEVHDALLQSGGVYIKVNKKVEATFAVSDDDVYISTRLRGNFIYNVNTGWNRPNRP